MTSAHHNAAWALYHWDRYLTATAAPDDESAKLIAACVPLLQPAAVDFATDDGATDFFSEVSNRLLLHVHRVRSGRALPEEMLVSLPARTARRTHCVFEIPPPTQLHDAHTPRAVGTNVRRVVMRGTCRSNSQRRLPAPLKSTYRGTTASLSTSLVRGA